MSRSESLAQRYFHPAFMINFLHKDLAPTRPSWQAATSVFVDE
jgi:hypothetical protein